MSLIISGGFKPFGHLKMHSPPIIPKVFDGVYPGWLGDTGVDTQQSFFTFSDNNTTITKKTTGIQNAVLNASFDGGFKYMEWIILKAAGVNYIGAANKTVNDTAWRTAISSTSMPIYINASGSAFCNGTAIGTLPALKDGDVVGMTFDFTGWTSNTMKVNCHVNGTWCNAGAVTVTKADVEAGTKFAGTPNAIAGNYAATTGFSTVIGGAVTFNAGQLSSLYKPANYSFLGQRDHAVHLWGAFGTQQVSDTRVAFTTPTHGGTFSPIAVSSVPFPPNSKIYFEVTANKIGAASARFGARHYRSAWNQNLGDARAITSSTTTLPSNTATLNEVGYAPTTGTIYSNNSSGANPTLRKSTVGGTNTWGFAIYSPPADNSARWFIRDATGYFGQDPADNLSGLLSPQCGDFHTYFAIVDGNQASATAYGDWSINTGASPFAYQVPSTYTPWNTVLASRTGYM